MKKQRRTYIRGSEGYSLIELILYTTALAGLLLVLSSLFSSMIEVQDRQAAMRDVEQQGIQVAQAITQAVVGAESVISPALSGSGSSLILDPRGTGGQLTIEVESEVILITTDTVTDVPLHNSDVRALNVSFTNVGTIDTPGAVSYFFTLSYGDQPAGKVDVPYSQTFYSTVTLHP